ncbi:hypothetical protein [Flavobacterium yafengii]|uniref:Uncharacterized protein n=1 Tax=Flavobacterium yafengii TaxID=3041253 RepID=A0AAW6TV10_9FLAO|nr:hypothetical protein [Flavobacterium yafengii]MDI5951268.1 hypothetical protein [Flavobacterium yafengii]
MLHYPYFKQCDKRYYQAVNEIYKDLSELNAETFRAIGRLNESQFFLFLANYVYYFRFTDIDITTLKHFFYIHYNYTIENNDPLPFQDYKEVKEEDKFSNMPEESLALNCKKKLSKLVMFYLEMREYPKETQSHMLLLLSEKIHLDVLFPLITFKSALIDYVDNENILETDSNIKKNSFLLDINGVLVEYENYLEKLQSQIHDRVIVLNKSKNENRKGNFQISTDSTDLRKLYHGLEKFMFINQNKTSLNQFIEVFENDWESHNSIVYFEMDNILFKYFIELLETYFDIKIQLSSIEYSSKIANKNGLIKAGPVYSSMAQYRKYLKDRDDIKTLKSMFEKIKNH